MSWSIASFVLTERCVGSVIRHFRCVTLRAGDPVAGVAEDVTERRQLEMQLHQAQKMDAIGQLAAGVAHDFNNLLIGHFRPQRATGHGVALGRRWSESIAEIRRATELGSTSIRQLLAFSRQQILEPKVLDLNAVVAEAEKMLRRLDRRGRALSHHSATAD